MHIYSHWNKSLDPSGVEGTYCEPKVSFWDGALSMAQHELCPRHGGHSAWWIALMNTLTTAPETVCIPTSRYFSFHIGEMAGNTPGNSIHWEDRVTSDWHYSAAAVQCWLTALCQASPYVNQAGLYSCSASWP